jgi:hypothetical protein
MAIAATLTVENRRMNMMLDEEATLSIGGATAITAMMNAETIRVSAFPR